MLSPRLWKGAPRVNDTGYLVNDVFFKKIFFPEIRQAATSTARTMGSARTAPAAGPGATTGASTGTTGAVSRHRKHGHSHFFFL